MASIVSRAAVIGSGVMGAGIAAHMANAGISVVLLDIVPDGAEDRSILAGKAVERLASIRPPALAAPECACSIRPGNFEDHLALLADVEWVVEAVVEDLAIKRDVLYRAAMAAPKAAISSNTSTLSLESLVEGMPEAVAKRMLITHFFNPPRQMKLVEIICGPSTDSGILARVEDACDRQLGKSMIRCGDTPGFIANRLGTYWMCKAVAEALAQAVAPAQADLILGRSFGIPPTGVFGLLDLIGLDTIEKGCTGLLASLDDADPLRGPGEAAAALFGAMVKSGLLGRKSKAGFYRSAVMPDGASLRGELDLTTFEYRDVASRSAETLPGGGRDPAALIFDGGPVGTYAWSVLSGTFAYACDMVPETAGTPADVDDAMTLGYGWRKGPFQLMDAIGLDALRERYRSSGLAVPALLESSGASFYRDRPGGHSVMTGSGRAVPIERPEGVLTVEDLRRTRRPVIGDRRASLWDMGEGVALFEIHTKMNTLDGELANFMSESLEVVRDRFQALVIGGDATNFSAGADLARTVEWIKAGKLVTLAETLASGQRAMLDLKYSPFPVVGALAGFALGGGCEVVLHCDAVQAHLECTIGLVEKNVGILPGWGGIAQMLVRHTEATGNPVEGAIAAFDTIGHAATATSAHLARKRLFLRQRDGISMNRDRLLADAKALALALVPDYRPPERPKFDFGSDELHAGLNDAARSLSEDKDMSPYDLVIADTLAWVLGGGDARPASGDEAFLHGLERAAILRLALNEQTVARMEHMLATGRPLRN